MPFYIALEISIVYVLQIFIWEKELIVTQMACAFSNFMRKMHPKQTLGLWEVGGRRQFSWHGPVTAEEQTMKWPAERQLLSQSTY